MSRIIRVTNVTFVTNVMQTLELVFGYEKVVPANPTATLASSNSLLERGAPLAQRPNLRRVQESIIEARQGERYGSTKGGQ
jgi:hypothetical protein